MSNVIGAFGWLVPWFLIVSVGTLAAMLICRHFFTRPEKRNLGSFLGFWLLVCWYVGVAMTTIIPVSGSVPIVFEGEEVLGYSLIPFDGWIDHYGLNTVAVRESILNVILFIPGMILTLRFTRMNAKSAFLTVIGFGVLIEIIQLLTGWGRVLTITDIIMYSAGAVAGWGLYALLLRPRMKPAVEPIPREPVA